MTLLADRGAPEGEDRRKAWLGAAFMATLCADAGFVWIPTPGEADVHSLDGSIVFWPGQATPVQVKGTSHFSRSKSYLITKAWRRNWGQLSHPAYLVVVTVPRNVGSWIYHQEAKRTLVDCAAYWARIDGLAADATSVQVQVQKRLTMETLLEWRDEALANAGPLGGFGGGWAT